MKINYPRYKHNRIIATCKQCNCEFNTVIHKNKQFCSINCYQLYRKINKKDERLQNILYQKKHRYGLSNKQYINLLDEIKSCEICNVSFDNEVACVDHDHVNGNIRGLLCHNCNRSLGLFKDNITSLQNAILYLEKNNKSNE